MDKEIFKKEKVTWFRKELLQWFSKNGRRFFWRNPSTSPFAKIIAELLLQRTTAPAVSGYIKKFIKQFPSWDSLAAARIKTIENALKPLGLWRRRALSLKALSIEIKGRGNKFPKDRKTLESLPGIGQYMANAILVLRFGIPQPFLDTNMARLLERFFGPRKLADIRDDPYLQKLAHRVVNHKRTVEINYAILDFGALICKSVNPKCDICPLAEKCLYFENIYSRKLWSPET